MEDFRHRFEFIYKTFFQAASKKGEKASKLALAKFLGISQGRLQNWESGKTPQPEDLRKLHDLFGFSYAWLVTGEGEPFDGLQTSADRWRMEELEKEVFALKTQVAQMEAELREERTLNRQLTTKLLIEGDSTEKSVGATAARAAGQE